MKLTNTNPWTLAAGEAFVLALYWILFLTKNTPGHVTGTYTVIVLIGAGILAGVVIWLCVGLVRSARERPGNGRLTLTIMTTFVFVLSYVVVGYAGAYWDFGSKSNLVNLLLIWMPSTFPWGHSALLALAIFRPPRSCPVVFRPARCLWTC